MRNIGKISETVLDRSVTKIIKNHKVDIKGAAKGLDCAFFSDMAVSTGYVAFADDDAGSHAVINACNNLWASFVKPEYISLAISMPDSYREIRLKEIMKQICETAHELDVRIMGGHTEYVKGLAEPIISVTAFGNTLRALPESEKAKEADIVMTKWIGLMGTSVISKKKRDDLITRLPAYYVDDAFRLGQFVSVADEAFLAFKSDKTYAMHDVSGGGIFAALWELCEDLKSGCRVELNRIPVRQETIEVCEFFDINPYSLRGDGALLIVTDDSQMLTKALTEKGILATVIGRTTQCIDRVILRDDETRFLESSNTDELIKVL
ncbi:MAG: hydrogenase maturation factor [Lachnospiraceae bacterium]|nr:hydrogenase maturation factor [Lachnospiraceae bacterium]